LVTTCTPNSIKLCEETLRLDRQYNIDHHILGSHVVVADRLLKRRLELLNAYREVYDALESHPHAIEAFFQVLMSTVAHWSPAKIEEARRARGELAQIDQAIASMGAKLAELLRRRSEIENTSAFHGDTLFHVCDVLEAAAADRPLFRGWLAEPLEALRTRFDLKYWPTLAAFVDVIAEDAARAAPTPLDRVTEAATRSTRASLADVFVALLANIEESSKRLGGWIPGGYRPSDAALAALVNCALDLDPDECVDSAYVKRLRQRQRDRET
jgi:hypothetical protein